MRITKRLIILTLALGFLLFCGLSLAVGVSGLRALGLRRPADLRQMFGPQQEVVVNEDLPLPERVPTTLRLEAGLGDVRVRGGGDRVRVRVTKRAERPDVAAARAAAEALTVAVEEVDGVLRLTVPRPLDENRPRLGRSTTDRVDFEITLPKQVALELDLTAGQADVADLSAAVNVVSRFGDLRLMDLAGPLSAELTAGTIEAERVGAAGETLKLSSRFGDVSVEDALGGLEVRTDSGGLRAERIQAGAENIVLVNRFGDLSLREATGGDCRLENQTGRLSLNRVTCGGSLTVKAQFGDQELEAVKAASAELSSRAGGLSWQGGEIAGGLQVDGGAGDLDFSRVLAAGYALSAEAGDISIALPGDLGLDLDLRSATGEIESDFHPSRSDEEDSRPGGSLSGAIGGGGRRLDASTRVGSIRLRRLPPAVGGSEGQPGSASTADPRLTPTATAATTDAADATAPGPIATTEGPTSPAATATAGR